MRQLLNDEDTQKAYAVVKERLGDSMKKMLFIGLASLALAGCGNEVAQSENASESPSENESARPTSKEDTAQTNNTVASQQEDEPVENNFNLSNKREVVFTAAENFLEVELSFDTKKDADMDVRRERREALEPYVTDELLGELEPTNEELEEKGWPIPTDDEEYDPTVSPVTNLMEYRYVLDDHEIFIDEESLDTNTVHVLADVFYRLETDMEGAREEYDEFRTYTFDVEQDDGEWVISDYEVIRDERFNSAE